jgi:predicted transcriptional regulator
MKKSKYLTNEDYDLGTLAIDDERTMRRLFTSQKFELLEAANFDGRLKKSDFAVLFALVQWNYGPLPGRNVYRANADLAIDIQLSRSAIIASRKRLEQYGYIRRGGISERGVPMYAVNYGNAAAILAKREERRALEKRFRGHECAHRHRRADERARGSKNKTLGVQILDSRGANFGPDILGETMKIPESLQEEPLESVREKKGEKL